MTMIKSQMILTAVSGPEECVCGLGENLVLRE